MSHLRSILQRRLNDFAARDFAEASIALQKQKAADRDAKRRRLQKIEDREVDLIINFFAGVGRGKISARQLDLFD